MRNLYIKIALIFVCISMLTVEEAIAQNDTKKSIIVPLSNPNNSGVLSLNLNSGMINITGYQGKEVIINAQTRDAKNTNTPNNKKLKSINNNPLEFSIIENDNKVIIGMSDTGTIIDFEIKVPRNFSLNLRLKNNGDIYVEGVNGEFEISNENGKTTLVNISGSAIVDTVNKDITINFLEVSNNAMAFSSLNGNLNITFPKNIKAIMKARSDEGEIFTDFELNKKLTLKKSKLSSSNNQNKHEWLIGEVNGGGPMISIKSLNGNITIRAKD